MADSAPQLGSADTGGSTSQLSGNATTTAIDLPTVAGNIIQSVMIENVITNSPVTKSLSVSFDGGVNWTVIRLGEVLAWSPKGSIRQFKLKSNVNGVDYQIILNFEDY